MKTIELTVLTFRESDGVNDIWVAQCREYGLIAQGNTKALVKKRFERTLRCQIYLDLMHGREPLSSCIQSSEEDLPVRLTAVLAQASDVQYRVPQRFLEEVTPA